MSTYVRSSACYLIALAIVAVACAHRADGVKDHVATPVADAATQSFPRDAQSRENASAPFMWFTQAEKDAISTWVRLNPNWTLIERERCSDREALARQEARVRGYHPFRARGDFNLDGFLDVAMAVESDDDLALVILNGIADGRFAKGRAAFLPLRVELPRANLFVDSRGALLVGPFESDNFFWVEPRGASYQLVPNDTSDYP